MFDPAQFMSTTVNGELSTEFTPVPEGEFNAVITKVDARQAGDSTILDVTWEVDDQGVREATGMNNPTVRQSVFLDLNASGGLDVGKGKNVQLGRLRDALGQNTPKPWAPGQMIGVAAVIRVAHRLYEGRTFADVKGVRKL